MARAKSKQEQNDAAILALKDKIQNKKAALAKVGRFNPVTNASLTMFGQRYNLNVIGADECLFLLGLMRSAVDGMAKENPEDLKEIKYNGFTYEQWLQDLKARFAVVNVKTEEARLRILEEKLHRLLSSDAKVSLELADLAKEVDV